MDHGGHCYKNSNLHPASAEEPLGRKIARELLLDEKGDYVGDDRAIFASNVSTDNDTRLANGFIREQNEIIGEASDNVAKHTPDKGHVIKCNNNGLFDLRKKDKSFNGVSGLSNIRIRSFNSDIKAVIDDYGNILMNNGYKDPAKRQVILDQLEAMVHHACGDHSKCKHEKWCTYLRVQNAHPDWTPQQVAEQASQDSHRPTGKNMSLSEQGKAQIYAEIRKRFNENTIDSIAENGCSNRSENFFNANTKFSQGKRLNQDLSDLWEKINQLTFCRLGDGNIEKTHDQVSQRMGLPIHRTERRHQTKAVKKRERDQKRQKSEKYKKSRSLAKMTKDLRMGKVDARKMYKSGKVPLTESAKSSVGKSSQKKPKKQGTCSNCKLPGHTRTTCKLPPQRKRVATELGLFDANTMEIAEANGIKAPKRRKQLDLVDIDDWI